VDRKTAVVTVARKIIRRFSYGKWIFLEASYSDYTNARLRHLESLNLDLSGKSVLEVGAGIGRLTQFFEGKGCAVLSTDGSLGNVNEMRRRYPRRRIEQLDLDTNPDLSNLGSFDVIFCYGTLYHLSKPAQALRALSQICKEIILLETRVALGSHSEVQYVHEVVGAEHAVSGVGCRPTRSWVMDRLKEYFGYAYQTRTQPRDETFPVDWCAPPEQMNYHAVFVGSKQPLNNPHLLAETPDHQDRVK